MGIIVGGIILIRGKLIFKLKSALRNIVCDSLDKYLNMLEAPALSTLNICADFSWGSNLIDTQFYSEENSIFKIELQMNLLGACYSTELKDFEVNKSNYYKDLLNKNIFF